MSTIENLRSHLLYTELNAAAEPANRAWFDNLQKTFNDERRLTFEDPPGLSESQWYFWKVTGATGQVLRVVERLEQARAYIRVPPEQHHQSRFAWLEYHLSYYTVLVTGLVDVSLLLVNEVLRLGLPARECKWQPIIKNQWVVLMHVAEPLQAINRFTERHRQIRNRHVHAGYGVDLGRVLDDREITALSTTEMMIQLYVRTQQPDPEPEIVQQGRDICEAGFEKTRDHLCRYLDDDLEQIASLLIKLFDALLPATRLWAGFNSASEQLADAIKAAGGLTPLFGGAGEAS
jgi:hypothetical protein